MLGEVAGVAALEVNRLDVRVEVAPLRERRAALVARVPHAEVALKVLREVALVRKGLGALVARVTLAAVDGRVVPLEVDLLRELRPALVAREASTVVCRSDVFEQTTRARVYDGALVAPKSIECFECAGGGGGQSRALRRGHV
jgi:hypothetical protein